MAITLDFESNNPSSNLGRTLIFFQEDDGIYCYTKGADTTVLEVISQFHEQGEIRRTKAALNAFAEDGLRTLLLAYRYILWFHTVYQLYNILRY